MLPEPTFTFTIPSIYDNTILDCRLYCPTHSVLNPIEGELWTPRGAIIAHPVRTFHVMTKKAMLTPNKYAPFGGCYDDWVVTIAAAEVLKQDFVVGTFNFR